MQAGLGLAVFKLPLDLPARPLRMAWHPRHSPDAAHRCLRECVRKVLAAKHALPSGKVAPPP